MNCRRQTPSKLIIEEKYEFHLTNKRNSSSVQRSFANIIQKYEQKKNCIQKLSNILKSKYTKDKIAKTHHNSNRNFQAMPSGNNFYEINGDKSDRISRVRKNMKSIKAEEFKKKEQHNMIQSIKLLPNNGKNYQSTLPPLDKTRVSTQQSDTTIKFRINHKRYVEMSARELLHDSNRNSIQINASVEKKFDFLRLRSKTNIDDTSNYW